MSKNPLTELIDSELDARAYGFDWPDTQMIIDQVHSECAEIQAAINQNESPERLQEEIGDLIHTAISLCVFAEFDVEQTISKVNTKFNKRMQAVKELTRQRGLDNLQGQSIEYMLEIWRSAKKATD